MTNPLVCVKRVVDSSGEVVLTEDGQGVDGRYAGFTLSAHEECAVELAVQVAGASDGSATVLTLGDADAVEQLRAALAVGCTAATHVVADAQGYGPADVAREIAAVVRDHEAAGTPHELVLLGNDAADSGDFQVGIRLAYELGWPVVNGVSTVSVADGEVTASGAGPDGHETYRVVIAAAEHQDFGDGPAITPRLNPLPRSSRQVLTAAASAATVFFDKTLRGAPPSILDHISAPTDLVVEVYPLHGRELAPTD